MKQGLNLNKLTLISSGSLVGWGCGMIFGNWYSPISTFTFILSAVVIVMGLAKAYMLRDYLFI